VLDPRARVLRSRGQQAAAGIGPTHVVAAGGRLYVTDTQGGALLVFATRPKLELVRRVFLPGGPYGLAVDPGRHRLWVTLTARNEVVALAANGHPVPRRRLATVRQPDAIAVDSATGTLVIRGADRRVVQLVGPRDADAEHRG
jgi:DNA-binding beta-propeller fold protein YncE